MAAGLPPTKIQVAVEGMFRKPWPMRAATEGYSMDKVDESDLRYYAEHAQQLVNAIAVATDVRHEVAAAWLDIQFGAESYLVVLASICDKEFDQHRRVAAAFLLHLIGCRLDIPCETAEVENGSLLILVESCDAAAESVRVLAHRLIAAGDMPEACKTSLQRTVRQRHGKTAVLAASALACHGARSQLVLEQLRRGISDPSLGVRRDAALGIVHLAIRSPSGLDALLLLLIQDDDACVMELLGAMKEVRPRGVRVQAVVSELALDQLRSIAVRAKAAEILGIVAKDVRAARGTLAALAQENDWAILSGVTAGCIALKWFPEGVVQRLALHVKDSDPQRRIAAMDFLSRLGPAARTALPTLIARLGMETDYDAVAALGTALAACGADAVPYLLGSINDGEYMALVPVSIALGLLGDSAGPALREVLFRDNDPMILGAALSAIRSMGVAAKSLEPELNAMLETERDELIAALLVDALAALGPPSESTVESMLRCVLRGGESLARRSAAVLRTAGPDIAPLLLDASRYAPAEQRDRIARIMDGWQTAVDPRFKRFEAFGDDQSLQQYALTLQVLCEHGLVGMRQVERILRNEQMACVVPANIPITARSLGTAVERVEKAFSISATERIPGRKGPVTEAGRQLLLDIQDFLQYRERQREHVK